MNTKHYFSILGLIVVCSITGTACAAKHPAEKAAAKKPAVVMSDASLSDIVQGLSDFEKRASKYSKDEWNFVLGYANYRHGKWKEADALLKDLDEKLPKISDHIIFYRVVIANNLGDNASALKFLTQLKTEHPDTVWTEEMKIERAKALIAAKRFKEARQEISDYKKRSNVEKTFVADLLLARSYVEEGDADEAVSFVKNMALSADCEAQIKELGGLFAEIKKKFKVDIAEELNGAMEQYRLAQSFSNRNQWDEAAARLEKIVSSKALDKGMRTQAKWLLAKSLRSIHRYDEAIKLMEELLSDPEAKGFEDNVMSTLATTYTKKNEYEKAIKLRQKMMDENIAPAHQMIGKIAFLYMDEGKYKEAIPMFRQVAAKGGAGRETSLWYLAWCNYMSGNYPEALSTIEGMLKGGKGSGIHDRLLYWKGRILEKMGEKGAANSVFAAVASEHPSGYYSEIAKRRLSGDKRSVEDFALVKGDSEDASAFDSTQNAELGGDGHLGKASFFDRLKLHEEAAREIRSGDISGGSPVVLALAARNFAHDLPYRFAEGRYRKELKGSPLSGSLDKSIWMSAYPKAYDPLVSRLVRESDVDPKLVWSIMRNESAFRPEVESPAGAVGLMQLMPSTAARMSREDGKGDIDRSALYHPSSNIQFGISYLKKLSKMFPKNPVAWIASYNAGEEAVGRWIKNGKLNDVEEWIEEIPYNETNLYVKKVLNSYWKYQRLY